MPSLAQQGIILTRQHKDHQGHSQLNYWLATSDGPVKLQLPNQAITFFIESEQLDAFTQILAKRRIGFHHQSVTLKTFQHKPVSAIYFSSLQSFYDAKRLLSKSDITLYEADIRQQDRYLMERFICSAVEFVGQRSSVNGYITYQQAQLKPAAALDLASLNLHILSIDIECSMQSELYSIAIQGTSKAGEVAFVLMIGDEERHTKAVNIIWLADEKSLLQAFVAQIQMLDPDIIIGWNVINFDFRLLITRMQRYQVKFAIGRDHTEPKWRNAKNEVNQGYISIEGRVVIDGIDALKTATYHFDSFSLDFVAQQLLARGKNIADVANRAEHITHDFHHNKIKLAAYNLEDCQLVSDIFSHTQLIDFLLLRSQLTGLELDRLGGSVAAFTNLYLPKLHRAGYVAPNLPEDGGLASPGGYVMSSIPGLYKNVLVLDYKSLYPAIIRTFKIDPLGLIEGLITPEKAIPGFKDAYFDREKHFLPQIISDLWQQRDQAKLAKDLPRSQAIKIIMNSFYGVLGSGGCRFYDTRLASSITLRGHEIMQQTAKWIEEAGYQVIYGDTDSTFVRLDEAIAETASAQIGHQLADDINLKWRQKLTDDYDIDSALEIEFETHYLRFLMPTIRGSEAGSKKRYAGTKRNKNEIELVFKGLETVRSDWTELAKSFQMNLYQLVFNDEDPVSFIQTLLQRILAGDCDHQLIYKKRLRRTLSSYVKNVPPHVKAARLADHFNELKGFPLQYQNKGWIQYRMTLNGPEPIEYQTSAIDYQHYIDKQIKPIADAILPFIDISFKQINNPQLSLF